MQINKMIKNQRHAASLYIAPGFALLVVSALNLGGLV